jgi:RNA polymerase sigma-70 factor (ECF subfamily)
VGEQLFAKVHDMTDWSQIVQQHGPIVWRTAHRLLNNDADACDCFQRTFISALELERTEVIRNWPALLKRLATARALERLRQRRRESSRLTALAERSLIDRKRVGPVQAAEASELAEHLREALAELDDRQAQVFCLACLDGLRYQEIADLLGVTVNHVGVLLNRARATLCERLQAHGPMPAAGPFPRELES